MHSAIAAPSPTDTKRTASIIGLHVGTSQQAVYSRKTGLMNAKLRRCIGWCTTISAAQFDLLRLIISAEPHRAFLTWVVARSHTVCRRADTVPLLIQ